MPPNTTLLIRNAEVNGQPGQDVFIRDGQVAAIGHKLPCSSGVESILADGGALLPGLKDHHIHLAALAVARDSLSCGPPDITTADQLAEALQQRAASLPGQWIRGIGYHDSVAGGIDAAWLDQQVPDTPVRIQHRGGRLWILNTAAVRALRVGSDDPFERLDGQLSGRLYEGDAWLRERMAAMGQGGFPDLAAISQELASYGLTGLTDTGPHNNTQTLEHFNVAIESGALLQSIRVMGDASLDGVHSSVAGLSIGEHKFHLLESALPDLDNTIQAIRQSHAHDRNVAFHCVTRTELAFALAAIREAGTQIGDRIEHASVTPPELLAQLAELGLTVVTQPALIAERGDHYLADVEACDQAWLYRLKSLRQAGLALAGSSDAPYTDPSPWRAMHAAFSRFTRNGHALGVGEAVSCEQALALYTGPLHAPGQGTTALKPGMPADLCLLAHDWAHACDNLAEVRVRLTLRAGCIIWT